MEYMDAQMQLIMDSAAAEYRRNSMMKQFVDHAVHRAMRHLDHIDRDDIRERDVHHIAISAALNALHLAIESDGMIKQLTAERDHYKKAAEGLSPFVSSPHILRDREGTKF